MFDCNCLDSQKNAVFQKEIEKAAGQKGFLLEQYRICADEHGLIWAESHKENRRTRIGLVDNGVIHITKVRKPKSASSLGKHPVSFYVYEDMYIVLQKNATKDGVTVSELLRKLVYDNYIAKPQRR